MDISLFLLPITLCLVTQSCPTRCDLMDSSPMDCSPVDCRIFGSSVYGDSPSKNTAVGCHALLQGMFPNQGLNPGLLHCRQILYQLSYHGNPPITLIRVNISKVWFPNNFYILIDIDLYKWVHWYLMWIIGTMSFLLLWFDLKASDIWANSTSLLII